MVEVHGGGERDRTDDLLLAKQALSQLSYTPFARDQESELLLPALASPACDGADAGGSDYRSLIPAF